MKEEERDEQPWRRRKEEGEAYQQIWSLFKLSNTKIFTQKWMKRMEAKRAKRGRVREGKSREREREEREREGQGPAKRERGQLTSCPICSERGVGKQKRE